MIEQSREELFALAKKKRQEQMKEQRNSSYSSSRTPRSEYGALTHESLRIFRLLGNPLYARKSRFDANMAFIATVKGDDDRNFRLVFPDREKNRSWLLWRVYDKVLAYDYVKNELGQGQRKYRNVTSHPETFWRVYKNGNSDPSTNRYERGWNPTAYVNINVIDRQDSWCSENHHTKLLSNRASVLQGGDVWYAPGIKKSLYDYIWDNVIAAGDGPSDTYDIAIQTLQVEPWYRAYSCDRDYRTIPEELRQYIHEGSLTEEEKMYEEYDLDELYGVTTYVRIDSKLGNFIKKVDIDYGTTFYDELQSLKEEEAKRFEAEGKNRWGYRDDGSSSSEEKTTYGTSGTSQDTTGSVVTAPVRDSESESSSHQEQQTPATEVRTRPSNPVPKASEQTAVDWDGLAEGRYQYGGKACRYLGIPLLTDEEKATIIGIDKNGQLLYKKEDDTGNHRSMTLFKDPDTGFVTPEFFHVDPLTGTLYS